MVVALIIIIAALLVSLFACFCVSSRESRKEEKE